MSSGLVIKMAAVRSETAAFKASISGIPFHPDKFNNLKTCSSGVAASHGWEK